MIIFGETAKAFTMSDTNRPMVYDPTYIAFTIPGFKEFGSLLHDRLHAVLFYMEEPKGKIMLITNLFDRDPVRIEQLRIDGVSDLEALLYCGTDSQRRILEKDAPTYYIEQSQGVWDRREWNIKRDANWNALHNREITRDMKEVETFKYFEQFRGGELDISSIEVGHLKKYFDNLDNELKENEYPVITDYFDVNQDAYVGIPLLGLGRFQGIVWIVFKKDEEFRFKDPVALKRIIKLFGLEYDNLLMSWAEFSDKSTLSMDAIKNMEENNPIHKTLKTRTFYKISNKFHETRVRQNKLLQDQRQKQHQKTAIISILLDSYAHNVGAHSLTALSWWFRERAIYLGENKKQMIKDLGREDNVLIRHAILPNLPPLSRELYPLFKFLQEKGAFWSGINRLTNTTGKVSSMYNVLWYDFINNPLYLGSLAYTEYVRKLHLHITFYEEEIKDDNTTFVNVKKIKRSPDGILLAGVFASIDMVDFIKVEEESGSVFIKTGALYEPLKNQLQQTHVFFPGGVVGKHAFFTLLENEIRNIKHYKPGPVLDKIQKEGLTIHLSMHERPLDSSQPIPTSQYQLLKIGVWIGHPQPLSADLLLDRIGALDQNIITDDTARPRLGGTYQDKICASMLLTSTFDQVQEENTPLSRIYYPWIKTAGCNISLQREESSTEFEVSFRQFRGVGTEGFLETFIPYAGEGFLKKYFHLWKGDDIKCVDQIQDFTTNTGLENYTRFRFLHLHDRNPASITAIKSNGLIRLLTNDMEPKSLEEAYTSWLPKWTKNLDGNSDMVFDFCRGNTLVGRLTYCGGDTWFDSYQKIRDLVDDDDYESQYQAIPNRYRLEIDHATENRIDPHKFNFRSHGMLVRYYGEGKGLTEINEMQQVLAQELFEVLSTRICIVDNRIFERFFSGPPNTIVESDITNPKLLPQFLRLGLYRDHLLLDIRSEDRRYWTALKQEGLMKYHFLVVHLSFIESMNYAESEILRFVDEEILQGASPFSVGDDFILVITTGRGRNIWWEKVKERPEYARFIAFRSVESMLGAVENALLLPDDFELKHNLVKVLFGS